MAYGITDYTVTITATDESGASTELVVGVDAPTVEDTILNPPVTEPGEEGALPATSLLASLSMLGAAVLLRREDDA